MWSSSVLDETALASAIVPFDLPRSERKVVGSFDRAREIGETLALESSLRECCGITRVADLTYLDQVGIPVFAAIVPAARDTISFYLGKGTTAAAARAGAIMEAVERYAASVSNATVGYDLITRAPTIVPRTSPRSSNGFASGNTRCEAVYHALCELVERHVLSVAHALAHERPRLALERFLGMRPDVAGFVDDPVACDVGRSGSPVVRDLIERFERVGLAVRLRAVELAPFPVVFVATVTETRAGEARSFPGFGCSLSPEHAAVRALTEAAQVRLVDISSAREDLAAGSTPSARPALPSLDGCWYFNAPARPREWDSLIDRSSQDLAVDVATMVAAIAHAGFDRVTVLDVSPPGLPIAVVQTVVPGLEKRLIDGSAGSTIAGILDLGRDPHELAAFR